MKRIATLVLLLVASAPAWATNVGGTISTNTTWALSGSPFIVTSDITVNAGVTLTAEPGVVVKANQYKRILINGTLTAVGTEAQPITFTSNQATPTAGYWRSIYFNTGSTGQLSYVTVSYGGQNDSASGYANIYVNESYPSMDHVTSTNSATAGIRVAGTSASPTITNCASSSNVGNGVRVDAGRCPVLC